VATTATVTTTTTTIRTTEPGSRARLGLLAVLLWACSAQRPAPSVAPKAKPAEPLHQGPLTDYVSAAGLRWLVLTKPQAVLANRELGQAITQIASQTRFDAFAESSGVDLRQVPHAAVAGFAYGTLYLAELPAGAASTARERFSDRLLTGATTKQPRPTLTRITGIVGQTPETLVTADDRLLAVAVGDPLPAKIVEAYAEERLKNSPSALHGSALSTLPDFSASAAALLAPGPLPEEWQAAAGGLLRSAVAVGIGVEPAAAGHLNATLCVSGAWGDTADAAGQQLLEAWRTFARSTTGSLYGLDPEARVRVDAELLTLNVDVTIAPLVHGLKAVVLSDISEIMSLPVRNSPARAPLEKPTTTTPQ